jgi:hypothetical protein
MPKIFNPTCNDTCFYCGKQANWVSVNTKISRCTEKITQCSGFIEKAENTRKQRTTAEDRIKHMKKMSVNGNKRLQELHSDSEWVLSKGDKISKKVKERGGHFGENNPMHNKTHTDSSKKLQAEKARRRNPESYKQASNTKIELGLATPKELKTQWELYQEQVTNFTNLSWKRYHDLINPNNLIRGDLYELDHKFSKTEGFNQGVPPEIIGHHANLELLPKKANRAKRTKCSITLNELYEATNVNLAPFSLSSLTSI